MYSQPGGALYSQEKFCGSELSYQQTWQGDPVNVRNTALNRDAGSRRQLFQVNVG